MIPNALADKPILKYTVISIACLWTSLATGREVRVAISSYCPYSCMEYELEGVSVEIIKMALPPDQYKVSLISPPWSRSLSQLRSGKADILSTAGSKHLKSYLHYSESPIFSDKICFFGKKDLPWKYNKPSSLQQVSLGLVSNYSCPEEIKSIIDEVSKPAVWFSDNGSSIIDRGLKMLISNRFDVMPSLQSTTVHRIKQLVFGHKIENKGCLESDFSEYIGVSKSTEDSLQLIDKINRTITNLKSSGELKEMLKKYGIRED